MCIRWDSPFSHSFAHRLFRQHFTELNGMYWSFVPAANKTEQQVKKEEKSKGTQPIDFFVVHDEDDRRIADSFDTWGKNYRLFQCFTRQNMILALNSCFEVYLRSITMLAIESKPGVIFSSKDSIDGAKLLKHSESYVKYSKDNPFYKHVQSICTGTWDSRVKAYSKLFGTPPDKLEQGKSELDSMRKLRNKIAHQFGRYDSKDVIPILINTQPICQISHKSLLKYFALVDEIELSIDAQLTKDFIGSYKVLKYCYKNKKIVDNPLIREAADLLKKGLGDLGVESVSKTYYMDLLKYYRTL